MIRFNKKISLGVFLVLWLFSGSIAAASSDQMLGQRFELPNGLVCLFSEQTGLPLVTLDLLIKAGVLQEQPGKAGLANLTAELLTLGTQTRTAKQISEELDFMGAKLSASGGQDFASLKLTVLRKDLPAALKILQDILLHPKFAAEEISRKVERLQAALKSEQDEPGIVADRAFRKALYGTFPYSYPIIGTKESLSTLTRQDLISFHQQQYRPNNAILSVVGDLRPAEMQQIAKDFFGSWERAPLAKPSLPSLPAQDKLRVIKIDKDITQANIILGKIGITRSNPDFYAFQVLNYILGGGGFTSRLMDNIRDNRGLAYNVASSFSPGLERGPFEIILETKNSQGGEAINEVLQELQRVRTDLASETELSEAKSYLINSLPMKMDSNAKRAWLMSYVEFYGLGLDYPWRFSELINRITGEEVRAVAQKYLSPDHYLLVVVGKQKEITLHLPSPWEERDKPRQAGE